LALVTLLLIWPAVPGSGRGSTVLPDHPWLGGTDCCCAAVGLLVWLLGVLHGSSLRVCGRQQALLGCLRGAWLLRSGAVALDPRCRWCFACLAGVLALLGWLGLAMMQARGIGVNFLVLGAAALVWIADVGAYFVAGAWVGSGSAVSLAPGISPGKTWEGAIGGMPVCAAGRRGLGQGRDPLRGGFLQSVRQAVCRGDRFLMLGVLFLTLMSVVGDLVESLFKRLAGVKDSSALLPGHGGVLDRLDALVPTLPLAMMIVTLGAVVKNAYSFWAPRARLA